MRMNFGFKRALLASVVMSLISGTVHAQNNGSMDSLDKLGDDLMKDVPAKAPGPKTAGSNKMKSLDSLGDDLMKDVPAKAIGMPSGDGKGDADLMKGLGLDNMGKGAPPPPPPAGMAAPASDEKGFFASLADNATYQLDAFGYGYFYDVDVQSDPDDQSLGAWGRFNVKTNAGVTDRIYFNLEASLIGDTGTSHRGLPTTPASHSVNPRYVEIDYMTLRFEQDDFDVLLGKADLSQGVGNLYSPANQYGNAYGGHPMHAYEMGTWQAKLNYFFGDDTLSLSVIPVDQRSSLPGTDSRWAGNYGGYTFTGLAANTSLTSHTYSLNPGNWGFLAKYQGVAAGVDYFGSIYSGLSPYAAVRTVPSGGEIFRPKVWSFAGGAATTIDRWKLYGEAVYQDTRENADESFVKYLGGVSYRETEFANSIGLKEIRPNIEYAGEFVTQEQTRGTRYLANSSGGRPFRDAVIGRLNIDVNDDWSGYLAGSKNFVDKDETVSAGVEYKHNDNLTFTFDGMFFNGDADTQFGRWKGNDNVRLGVSWKM